MKYDKLTMSLLSLAEAGRRTPCGDPASHSLWTSEHDKERALAVKLCGHCEIRTVCRDVAEEREETWGVFGGQDFSQRQGAKKRKRSA
jgi:transcription factor WhiB